MRLISTEELATLTGVSCSGSGASDKLSLILDMILPRVEDAMNVASLVRGSFVDTFVLPSARGTGDALNLRLSNGYVVDGTVVIEDRDGNVIADSDPTINNVMGIVSLGTWQRGTIRVKYESGFEPIPEDIPAPPPATGTIPKPVNELVLKDVPDWIKALVCGFAVEWLRTFQIPPQHNKDLSYSQVEAALRRHIYARVYARYMRPRADVIWSSNMATL